MTQAPTAEREMVAADIMLPTFSQHHYRLEAMVSVAIRRALEEAAKVAEEWNRNSLTGKAHETSVNIATAIRARAADGGMG